jgi:hypothetical protein
MNCAWCDHPESDHCKGHQMHTDHKEDQRMVPIKSRTGTVICETRHCTQPLCSCVAYMGPNDKREAA